MALGIVLAVLLCSGSRCEMIQVEAGVSYPGYDQCSAALDAKSAKLDELLAQRHPAPRRAEMICVRETQTLREVEEPYDVLETAIVHLEPSVDSAYVGSVESGQRTLVTGIVAGTGWLRVLLSDGKSGFVYNEHLRKVGGGAPVSEASPRLPTPVQTAPRPAAPSPAQPLPSAPPSTVRAEFRDCPTCPVMLPVPPGSFAMGSSGDASERPVHRVVIAPFALSKLLVTVEEWSGCVADGGCAYKPPAQATTGKPVTNLSWDDAAQYVQWLRKVTGKPYRLPTEAEWEYAARAGTTTRYSWGDQVIPGRADCNGCGGQHDARSPQVMTGLPANPWGFFAMGGSAAEWVADCWRPTYQNAPVDGSAWTAPGCDRRVLRGGSWMNPPSDITVSSRNFYDAGVRYIANGMRVALDQR